MTMRSWIVYLGSFVWVQNEPPSRLMRVIVNLFGGDIVEY